MSSADSSTTTAPATAPAIPTAIPATAIDPVHWRTSSFSDRGNCVAVAHLGDDRVAVRNSNRPDAGTLDFPPAAVGAWIAAAKAGELDHLT